MGSSQDQVIAGFGSNLIKKLDLFNEIFQAGFVFTMMIIAFTVMVKFEIF